MVTSQESAVSTVYSVLSIHLPPFATHSECHAPVCPKRIAQQMIQQMCCSYVSNSDLSTAFLSSITAP